MTDGDRWQVAGAATLALVTLGVLYGSPVLLAGTVVPLTYLGYGALSAVPADAGLAIERAVSDADPVPGQRVTVDLVVENTGDAVLTDLRVVDGVPDELVVVEGSPRTCCSLRPGGVAEVTYEVVAKRGTYDFDAPLVRVRTLAGSDVHTDRVAVDGTGTLSATTALSETPDRREAVRRVGTLPTDSGGSGVEFHATREYRRGDAATRIDWRRYAKTGDLTTVEFREEGATRTVLVVDGRACNRVIPRPGYPTVAELGAHAAALTHGSMTAAGQRVEVAAVGVDDTAADGDTGADAVGTRRGPEGVLWVDPETDAASVDVVFDRVVRAAERSAGGVGGMAEATGTDSEPDPTPEAATDGERTAPADVAESTVADGGRAADADGGGRTASDATDVPASVRSLVAGLPPTAQVVVFSPLLDHWPVAVCRTLAVHGYRTTVVSPDPTGGESPGQRLTDVSRTMRLRAVSGSGAETVDWDLDQSLSVTLRRTLPHLLS